MMDKKKLLLILCAVIMLGVIAVLLLPKGGSHPPVSTAKPTAVPTMAQTPTEAPTATSSPTEAPTETVPPTEVPTSTATPKATPRLVIDANVGSTPTPAPTEPGIAIPGWGGIKIPHGQTEAEVALLNPKDNDGWYYLTFELRLTDTDEVVFSTGLIPPGMYCTKVNLTRDFEVGDYPATMHVQPYRMNDDLTPTNNAVFNLVLMVQ